MSQNLDSDSSFFVSLKHHEMKRLFFLLLPIFSCLIPMRGASAFSVDKIEPPHWWVGMNDNTLQLQIYGHGVGDAKFRVFSQGVTVDSVVSPSESGNWQYAYLTIDPSTPPGDIRLEWEKDGRKVTEKYSLRERKRQRGAGGFSTADVLYLVMPDRFADGDPSNNRVKEMRFVAEVDRHNPNIRHGGDLKGIEEHIDYIDSLGVTAVWFNPVLENDMPGGSYHGYATTDYYNVDPRFGGNEGYAGVISQLHDRGIKTVMDMIFNHCGSEHPWLADPPAPDWFNFGGKFTQTNHRLSTVMDPYASDYDRKLAVDGWFVREMPDLNQRNSHLMKYLIQNSIWWIEEAQIDAIRMDTYPYADLTEMGKWVAAVENEYPDFTIVGECWYIEPAMEQYWQRKSPVAAAAGTDTNLPVVMDFALMNKVKDLAPFRKQTDTWGGLNDMYNHLAIDFIYPDPDKVLRFLDNHDTERVILEVPENLDQWKQAVTFLLTIPGIPQLYYGTELLMSGDRKPGDGNVRKDMPGGFPEDTVDAFTREGRTELQNEAFDFISLLCNWRKGNEAIAGGSMRHFVPDNGIYLYVRENEDRQVVVIMNGNDTPVEADMSRYAEVIPSGASFLDILSGDEVVPISGSGEDMMFEPRRIMILDRKKQ